ncbi:hypothetical protein MUK42_20268 [Musa troglodytarum]|uniref:AT-hook motif nuclear-localized protein n=1 Tax=Musa troglodytarum TaxID=320322 RepID=A0A9E7H6Z9_9LILI|nr:hypothetical protein MUK42_20268 [Musa troglodytarum]
MDPRRIPSYPYFKIRRLPYYFRRVQATEQHDIRDGSSGVLSPAENVPSDPTPASQPAEQHDIRDGSSGVLSPAENVPSDPTPASQPAEQHDIRDGSSGALSPAENVPSDPTPASQPAEQHDIRDGSSGVLSPAENVPSDPTPASQPTEQHDIRDGSSGVLSPAENVPSDPTPASQPAEQHDIRDGSSGVLSPAENVPSDPTPASQPTEQHDIRDGSSGVFSPAENVPSNPTPVSLASTPSFDPGASASQVPLRPRSVPRKRGRPRIHPPRAVDQRTTSSPLPGPSSSLAAADAPLPDQPVRRKRGRPRGRSRKALGQSTASGFVLIAFLGNAGCNFMTHVLTIGTGEIIRDVERDMVVNRAIYALVYGESQTKPIQGCHEIISLSGTFVDKTPVGASVTRGLAICLASSSGHLVGGRLDGPLTAAYPVQIWNVMSTAADLQFFVHYSSS